MKQIVTINMNHICPMVTGTVPHVGGPIVGPGCPGVLVDDVPVSVIGDTCICNGPPDVVVQGYPGVLIDGVPVVVQNSMTAHGGIVPMGVSGVVIDSATPVALGTMDVRTKIPIADNIRSAFSSHSKSMQEARANIQKLKQEAAQQEKMVYNLRWEKNGKRVYSERIDEDVKMVADTLGIANGETVKVKVYIDKDSNRLKEIDCVVKDDKIEVGWDVLSKDFHKEDE